MAGQAQGGGEVVDSLPSSAPLTHDERKDAEQAYTITAFDYEAAPVGSRDWGIYWRGWWHRAICYTAPPSAPVGVDIAEAVMQSDGVCPTCFQGLHIVSALRSQVDGMRSGLAMCERDKKGWKERALAQRPAAVDGAMELLREIRDLLWSLPKDCMGSDTDASGQPYPIRDEVIDNITKQLAAQPGGSE